MTINKAARWRAQHATSARNTGGNASVSCTGGNVSRTPANQTRKHALAHVAGQAQGQTLKRVGLYLPTPVFSHGQLYVALSRVGASSHIAALVEDTD